MAGSVAVLGLGAMGLPMARALGRRFEVHGFDSSEERLRLASESGIAPEESAAGAAAAADVVVVSVRDGVQAASALLGPRGAIEGLREGEVVIVTSTIGRAAVADIGAALSGLGVHTVDAPVSGGPGRAGEGDLLIMVGAAPEALAPAMPVLEALAGDLEVVGDSLGDGQALKIVNQLLCGVHIAAAAEALALADRFGLDLERTLSVLAKGAADSFMLRDRGQRMVRPAPRPVNSRMDIFVKDMGMVLEAARGSLPLPVAAAAEQLYALAAGQGMDGLDDSELIDLLRGEREGG